MYISSIVKYKDIGTTSLFSEDYRLEKLSKQGDPLERLNTVVEWEYFRKTIETIHDKKLVSAGPKSYNPLLMFKILILQRYYNLSDYQVEYQILDRLTFCRFLGITLNDKVPDEKTIWGFRDKLITKQLEKELFTKFSSLLENNGLIEHEGKIIDASFTVAPRQRNSRDENKKIKEGKGDELWNDKPHKKSHKDIDARWTTKNGEKFYGYKNHAKVDNKGKFIKKYTVTDASVRDSQALDDLLDEEDKGQYLYADSAYTGEKQEETIDKYKMNNKVHEKGYRNKPLTQEQKANNTTKSKTKARVEYIFGFMEQSMNGLKLRSVGIKRAKGVIGLINFTYNLFRYEQVVRLNIV